MKQKILLITFIVGLLPQLANAQWFWESAESLYEQGMEYLKSKDYDNAVAYFSKSAEKGFSKAQNRLGIMNLKGIGVNQNEAKAYTYFVQGYNNNKNYCCPIKTTNDFHIAFANNCRGYFCNLRQKVILERLF